MNEASPQPPALELEIHPEPLAVCRLPAAAAAPAVSTAAGFRSVTRTADELSVVCPEPEALAVAAAGGAVEPGWLRLAVRGPLDFALTGILARLAAPLARAGVPIFAVSTYDTDHLLVGADRLAEAVAALRGAGFGVFRRLAVAGTWDGAPVGADERVELDVGGGADELVVRVDAPFHGDPAPPAPPGPTPRLWEHEAVELFVAAEAADPAAVRYTEIELGPRGHHLVLRLEGVRRVVEEEIPIAYRARVESGRWRGEARLPRALLPPPPHRVNAYALHGPAPARRHLAMAPVPGERPDFHRPERFEAMAI